MGFSRQEYWSGLSCPPLGDLPNPGIKLRSPALQADSLPSEPPGKPKKTGVGSLYLLQGSFLIQELNWGLLHCRWILYQLSYPGSPTSHGLLLHQYITIYMVFWECVLLGLWGLVLCPGIEPVLDSESILTTGPPGNSPFILLTFFSNIIFLTTIAVFGLEDNIAKILSKLFIQYDFYEKSRLPFFLAEINILILKCTWKCKGLRIAKQS